jgi:hypothetical protein
MAGGVAQGEGPEFKPQYLKKKKKKDIFLFHSLKLFHMSLTLIDRRLECTNYFLTFIMKW